MDDFSTSCIHQLFEHQAARTPDQIALIFEGTTLSYAELNNKANQLAHYLQDKGVKPETLVGICVNRSLDMMVALLAILKAGGAYVPFDPDYPQERLSFIAEDTGIDLLITQSDLTAGLPVFNCELYTLDTDSQQLSAYPTSNAVSDVKAENLAYVIYTSGSTGIPKGVMMQHDSVSNQLMWIAQYLQINNTDIILQQTSISFDVSVLELFEGLISGGKLVIAKPDGHRDNLYIIDLIQSQNITTMHLSPSVLKILMDTSGFDQSVSLRQVCSAGEALPVSIANNFSNRSNASLFNMYGPTEAAVIATSSPITKKINRNSVPIGKAVNNTQLYILDENYQLVSEGEVGELYIGGIQVARGYLNRPELTQERFIKGLFNQKQLYKTGDRARYLANNDIDYLGRVDHQIQLRGNRIEPGEIETRLIQHPDIKNALVVLREGQFNNQYMVAYLISDTSINNSEIRAFLALTLISSMIPSAFVTLKEFPLTINGKVDRQALPEPHYYRSRTDKDFTAARNDSEQSLSTLWSELLSLQDVGIHDNFFEWGGDSLLAVELTHQMETILKLNLPIMYIFENPTIVAILANLESLDQRVNYSSLVNVQLKGSKTPLFYIGTTGYASNLATVLADDQPIYGLNVFGVPEAVNPDLPVTIEIIAKQFLADIRKIQPIGPYQIASFCADTVMAYELAQQLYQQGQSVSLFATIDTVWNEDPNNIMNTGQPFAIARYLNLPLLMHKLLSRIKTIKKKHFVTQNISNDLKEKHRQFIIKFNNAQRTYVPKKYAGKIISFLSQEYLQNFNKTNLETFTINKEDHKEYIINGFHDSLFERPYLDDLADHLKRSLQ
jgi:amino acid adenylation domain-containing protein